MIMNPVPRHSALNALFRSLFIPLLLSGCAVTSTVVSSMGARSLTGKAVESPLAEEMEVPLLDSARVMPGAAVAHFAAIPYSSLSLEPDGRPAGRIVIKPAEVAWSSATQGAITLLHEGALLQFEVSRRQFEGQRFIAVEHRYREWYGYPAQGLLLLTLPLDLVIDAVALGGMLISMPVVYGVRALRGEDSANAGSAAMTPSP
jgi:hypothetical protein